ncbi:glycosyltransferase family 39 protein, partial [Candidatus Woesearchaeota archaeon]|nr:glycosyltransferase family 39 protein [Candidatus Woesearchaeota archaeon]
MEEDKTTDEDEIKLDFSKVAGFFKKKAKKKETHKEETAEPSHAEFKAHETDHTSKKETSDDEKISFDINKIKTFMSTRTFSIILILILILIPMYFAVDFRMMSADLPITNNWARDTIYNNIRNQIANEVRAESPNLPPASIEREVNRRFEQVLDKEGSQLESVVSQTAAQFKAAMQDNDGQTYLLAIDPYQYFRYAADVIDHGYPGDVIREGEPYDMHMMAPKGSGADKNFHIYFGAYMYKLLGSLTGKSLMGIFFLLPVIIAALAVIPAFLIGRKLGGNVGGFFAALILAVHGAFLSRTPGGFSDTDAYNVFFPLLAVWLFLEAFSTEKIKFKILFSALAGLSIGLFAFAWAGSWFIFDILIAVGIIYLVYLLIVQLKAKTKILKHKPFLNNIYALLVFAVSSA